MRKNKLYVFLSILTIIFLFGTAAVCTQCGASIDKAIGDLGDNVDEEPQGTEPQGKQPSGTEPDETPPGEELPPDEEQEPEPEPEEEAEEPEEEETKETRLDVVPDETGFIEVTDTFVHSPEGIKVGTSDRIYKDGYISFDITDLTGVEVVSVTLRMDLNREFGDRSYLGNLRIGTLDYGTGPLRMEARDIPAKMLVQYTYPQKLDRK